MKQNIADQTPQGVNPVNAQLGDLVSMRMIYFFNVLRRSGVLAQRRLFNMTEAEWRIMVQVGLNEPLSLNQLADRTLQDRGQLSRTVKGMVERGLLTRERKRGGPTVEIALAPGGEDLYGKMVARAVERDRKLTQGFAPDDEAVLRRLMAQMIDRAEDLLEEERALGA